MPPLVGSKKLSMLGFICIFTGALLGMTQWHWPKKTQGPIYVGLLNAETLPESDLREAPMLQTFLMAIDELNESGGLLGRRVEPVLINSQVLRDGCYGHWTAVLVNDNDAWALFGGGDSGARKAMKYVAEFNNRLLFYPYPYEGIEASDRIIHLGGIPNQSVFPFVYWALNHFGKKKHYVLVHADDCMGRSMRIVLRDLFKIYEGIDLECLELSFEESAVSALVSSLRTSTPDVIIECIDVFSKKAEFYRTLKDSGWTRNSGKILGLGLSEAEAYAVGLEYVDGVYFSKTSFSRHSERFSKVLKERLDNKYGGNVHISEALEAAYASVYLWANVVRELGTFDTELVLKLLLQKAHDTPVGKVCLHKDNLHAFKHFVLGQIQANGSSDVFLESDVLIDPEPFPRFRSQNEWQLLLDEVWKPIFKAGS